MTKDQKMIAEAYCGYVDYGYINPFSMKVRKPKVDVAHQTPQQQAVGRRVDAVKERN